MGLSLIFLVLLGACGRVSLCFPAYVSWVWGFFGAFISWGMNLRLGPSYRVLGVRDFNMFTCSTNCTQEWAVQDFLCLVWSICGLYHLISAPPLVQSLIGYNIVFLCLVYFTRSLYLEFQVWNGYLALGEAELWLFVLEGLKDSGLCSATSNDCHCGNGIALDSCI